MAFVLSESVGVPVLPRGISFPQSLSPVSVSSFIIGSSQKVWRYQRIALYICVTLATWLSILSVGDASPL